MTAEPFRVFIAGEEMLVVVASDAVNEAYDLLVADGVHPDKAADLAVTADKHGHDPVALARKFIRLRKALP